MKSLLITCAVFLMSFSMYLPWEQWYCVEGKFVINIPHVFEHKTQLLDAEWGEIEMQHYFLDDKNQYSSNLFYMISYSDYPADILHQDSLDLLDEFFDVTVQNSARAVGGEVIYANKDFDTDYPEVLYRINYERGALAIRSKAILANSRLYILKVFYDDKQSKLEDINSFFDSFELKNTKE